MNECLHCGPKWPKSGDPRCPVCGLSGADCTTLQLNKPWVVKNNRKVTADDFKQFEGDTRRLLHRQLDDLLDDMMMVYGRPLFYETGAVTEVSVSVQTPTEPKRNLYPNPTKGVSTYRVVRKFRDHPNSVVIKTGLTHDEAVKHCEDPESGSTTCQSSAGRVLTDKMGPWADFWYEEFIPAVQVEGT